MSDANVVMAMEMVTALVHEVERAYAKSLGIVIPSWDQLPEAKRLPVRAKVLAILRNVDQGPEAVHEEWLLKSKADGWKRGQVNDAKAKTNSYMVPFEELPLEVRTLTLLAFAVAKNANEMLAVLMSGDDQDTPKGTTSPSLN